MLDYKGIITKHYALGMGGMAIAKSLEVSVSGVNDFLRAFKECKTPCYPLPQVITNYGIAEAVYGKSPGGTGRDLSYEMPDYAAVEKEMSSRKTAARLSTTIVSPCWRRLRRLWRSRLPTT